MVRGQALLCMKSNLATNQDLEQVESDLEADIEAASPAEAPDVEADAGRS